MLVSVMWAGGMVLFLQVLVPVAPVRAQISGDRLPVCSREVQMAQSSHGRIIRRFSKLQVLKLLCCFSVPVIPQASETPEVLLCLSPGCR